MEPQPTRRDSSHVSYRVTLGRAFLAPLDSLGVAPGRPPVVRANLDDPAEQTGAYQGGPPHASAEQGPARWAAGGVGEDLAERARRVGRAMGGQQLHDERR